MRGTVKIGSERGAANRSNGEETVGLPNPYAPPAADQKRPPRKPVLRRPGGCSIVAAGSLIGCVLGTIYGIREFNEAAAEAERKFGFHDYMPFGVLLWACVGTILGALATGLFLRGWRLFARRSSGGARGKSTPG